MIAIDYEKMVKIVQGFKKKRILVLGDLMLDKYIWGDVTRISPEAPVPVVEVNKDTSCLGGAGNASHNLESLGAFPILVGIIGDDNEGAWIKKNVAFNKGIFIDGARPTTVKTRIIAHHQQVVRVDWEKKAPISSRMEEKILSFVYKIGHLLLEKIVNNIKEPTLENRIIIDEKKEDNKSVLDVRLAVLNDT